MTDTLPKVCREDEWYDVMIEDPLKELVKVLRNNGFNTECSCGHDMYIQCQCLLDGEVQRLHSLLFSYLYERDGMSGVNYHITVDVEVKDGCMYTSMTIQLPKEH